MELDEMSNDSTISNISYSQENSTFFFENDEYIYTPKVDELEPQINNITSTVNLGNNLNLKNISLKLKNAEYNSNKSSNLTLKIKNSKIAATIFQSGKMVCSGAKSEKESKSACIKFSKIVKKFGYNIELKNFTIQSISVTYDVKFKINLKKLFVEINCLINNSKKIKNNNSYCKLNKENFPGLIFYMDDYKANIFIFETGKVVLSGAKKRKEIGEIFKSIYPLIIEAKDVFNEEPLEI